MNVPGGNMLPLHFHTSLNNLHSSLHLFPESSLDFISEISEDLEFDLIIKKNRLTKLGDFKYPKAGSRPAISLNADSNRYRLLITYLHELAHLLVWLNNKSTRNPHGKKWKDTFAHLLELALQRQIFPRPLEDAVRNHTANPKASSHADFRLLQELKKFDINNHSQLLIELSDNQLFRLNNGKVYQKGEQRRTRILCSEVNSRRKYLIHAHAEVTAVE